MYIEEGSKPGRQYIYEVEVPPALSDGLIAPHRGGGKKRGI
jgi:hypothetical protein